MGEMMARNEVSACSEGKPPKAVRQSFRLVTRAAQSLSDLIRPMEQGTSRPCRQEDIGVQDASRIQRRLLCTRRADQRFNGGGVVAGGPINSAHRVTDPTKLLFRAPRLCTAEGSRLLNVCVTSEAVPRNSHTSIDLRFPTR